MDLLRRHHRKLLIGALIPALYLVGYAAVRGSHLIVRAETQWRYRWPDEGGGTDSSMIPGYYDQTEHHPHRALAGRVAVHAFWPLCEIESSLRSSEWNSACD